MVWWIRLLANRLPAGVEVATAATGPADVPPERWYLGLLRAGRLARALDGAHAVREGAERREVWLDTNGMLTFVLCLFVRC